MLRNPNSDAAPPETAHDAEPSIVAADHERAAITPRDGARHRVSALAIVRPAKPLPATNRMSGPNVVAAGAPIT